MKTPLLVGSKPSNGGSAVALLQGKTIVIAGIGDDQGFGWACAKACTEQGAKVVAATWVPLWRSFVQAYEEGRYAASQWCENGSLLEFADILPLDASFDRLDEVPDAIRLHKRYQGVEGYTVQEFAQRVQQRTGTIGGFIHSMANAPEIRRPLLQTSREGYLAAMSASAYSWVALVQRLAPLMERGSSAVTLSYDASQRVVVGYGGGMSAAKAALEADTRQLSFEAGRLYGIRVNAISAGPLASRAAKAIGEIHRMIESSRARAPLQETLEAKDVAQAAVFLLSPWARSITGSLLYVDYGLHAMGPVGEGLIERPAAD